MPDEELLSRRLKQVKAHVRAPRLGKRGKLFTLRHWPEARKLRELILKTTQPSPTDPPEGIGVDPMTLLAVALSPPDGWLQYFDATVDCKMLERRNPATYCNYYQREIDPNVDCASHARLVIEHYAATHPETEQAEVPAEATGEPLPSMPTIKIPIFFGIAHLLLALGIWFGFIQLWIHFLQPLFAFEASLSVGWAISFILLGVVIALRKRMYEWKEKLWLKIHGF